LPKLFGHFTSANASHALADANAPHAQGVD
jgi:hypothetical protein